MTNAAKTMQSLLHDAKKEAAKLRIELGQEREKNARLEKDLADAAAERRGRMPLKDELARVDAENRRLEQEIASLKEKARTVGAMGCVK